MNKFDQVEMLVRRFIEGAFDRLFQAQFHPADLAQQLTLAIEQSQPNGTRSRPHLIPNRYRIRLNPTDYAALMAGANGKDDIETALREHVAGLIREVSEIEKELRLAMFLTGSKNLTALRNARRMSA